MNYVICVCRSYSRYISATVLNIQSRNMPTKSQSHTPYECSVTSTKILRLGFKTKLKDIIYQVTKLNAQSTNTILLIYVIYLMDHSARPSRLIYVGLCLENIHRVLPVNDLWTIYYAYIDHILDIYQSQF